MNMENTTVFACLFFNPRAHRINKKIIMLLMHFKMRLFWEFILFENEKINSGC